MNADGLDSYTSWFDATIEVQNLGEPNCGLADGSRPGDWRMPTWPEWVNMTIAAVDAGCTGINGPALLNDPGTDCFKAGPTSFTNVDYSQDLGWYWSGTTALADSKAAHFMNLQNGTIHGNMCAKRTCYLYVWPVRDAQ